MDLFDLIRHQINALPSGDHLRGLRSVLHHLETAYKHFARGQSGGDESAFTDAIYRTNQAFEGSVKEAYRVLAGKDPQKMKPHEIEQYLLERKVFHDRILSQFTNYRTEWRNPSTHDYNLNFDEAQAFLATVSVSAFTKLLIDEIAERLNFVAVQKDVAIHGTAGTATLNASEPFVARVTLALRNFAKYHSTNHPSVPIESEAQLMGALSGFLSSVLPDAQTSTGRIFRAEKPYYIDMVISNGNENIIVELKRGQHRALLEHGVEQVSTYMKIADAKHGVLFLYSGKSTDYDLQIFDGPHPGTEIYVLRPGLEILNK